MYKYELGEISFDQKVAGHLCNHYHFWGMMVDKGHLPIWIFESESDPSIVRSYTILEEYIGEKREVNPSDKLYINGSIKIQFIK